MGGDGDSGIKREKLDQDATIEVPVETNVVEAMDVDLNVEPSQQTNLDTEEAGTSNIDLNKKTEEADTNHLPKELHEITFKDDKAHDQSDKAVETTVLKGNGIETGQIISTTIGGRNGQPKQTISYMAERVVGTGSFGIVFQAKCIETGEAVAIKKVLQDKRYKNRELQVMHLLDHPNVVQLKHYFYSTTDKNEDGGEKLISLLRAIGACPEGFSTDPYLRRASLLSNGFGGTLLSVYITFCK